MMSEFISPNYIIAICHLGHCLYPKQIRAYQFIIFWV
jgi:hypothetical protein